VRTRVTLALLAIVLVTAACGPGTGSRAGTPAASRHGVAPPPGFPLLGSWETTITRADLSAAGITDPGLLNENTGVFTWTFEPDGSWRQVQVSLDDSPILSPVYAGTYRVTADVVVAVTEFPDADRDSGIRYTYTLTGDAEVEFRIEDPPDDIVPIITETHPWRRVGT
jgi:hypothetical protein